MLEHLRKGTTDTVVHILKMRWIPPASMERE